MDKPVSRREFVQTSAAGVAAAGAVAGALSAPAPARAQGANGRIRIGFIGPGGRGFGAHVKSLAQLQNEGANVELVAVSDVYEANMNRAAEYIKKKTGNDPTRYVDYRDMLADEKVDAVCIGTPDHWHHLQTVDAMKAGKHVYCEKPMTHSVEEAIDVVNVWKETGKIMQVGVQSTSLPLWNEVRERLNAGELGKVLMYQTEYFRNSNVGQWRYYNLTKDMSPETVDWDRWLGVKEGLAPEMPFDRSVFAQWRCYWPFGSGMFTDLFVHRTTSMLKATGLRFPARVTGGGGLYLEYDGRDVPDVATVVADFKEGVQGLVTATMCCEDTPIRQLIRGHNGSFVFGNGERFDGFDFVPERPQVTGIGSIRRGDIKRISTEQIPNTTYAHFQNWIAAMESGDQMACNNPPDLGAAAITLVNLGARSYRQGKVFRFNDETMTVSDADGSWSKMWEARSEQRGKPSHIPGWNAGDTGSTLSPPDYMELAGPWKNGVPPEQQS
ncbi:Membrane or secreted protein containing Oxidoreductase [Planctomycetales bacterium 10988]|nr:Membrane or secreted protein containing Oxidoreductase [Planctomycetales bacterium 10988]